MQIRDVEQPGSLLAWGARGRWFESSHPDELNVHFYIKRGYPVGIASFTFNNIIF